MRLLGPTASVPRGVVVATAYLADYAKVITEGAGSVDVRYPDGYERSVETDDYGDFSLGRWLWFLEDVRPLDPPIPAKGRLNGFWDWPA